LIKIDIKRYMYIREDISRLLHKNIIQNWTSIRRGKDHKPGKHSQCINVCNFILCYVSLHLF